MSSKINLHVVIDRLKTDSSDSKKNFIDDWEGQSEKETRNQFEQRRSRGSEGNEWRS